MRNEVRNQVKGQFLKGLRWHIYQLRLCSAARIRKSYSRGLRKYGVSLSHIPDNLEYLFDKHLHDTCFLSTLQIVTHQMLITTLCNVYYFYPYCTDGETKT